MSNAIRALHGRREKPVQSMDVSIAYFNIASEGDQPNLNKSPRRPGLEVGVRKKVAPHCHTCWVRWYKNL